MEDYKCVPRGRCAWPTAVEAAKLKKLIKKRGTECGRWSPSTRAVLGIWLGYYLEEITTALLFLNEYLNDYN